ncbi:unnamed protein product, partial [Brenthis ino]
MGNKRRRKLKPKDYKKMLQEKCAAMCKKKNAGNSITDENSEPNYESPRVNNKRKERQQRYREQNREKLKQREAERRKRKQNLQMIAGPSTSSNILNRMELNNEEITDADESLSGLEGIQTPSVHKNKFAEDKDAVQKKRERQQRYRERNREKLKEREAERRQRQQNSEMIAESSTSSNIDWIEINGAGLEEKQNLFVEITER